MDSIKNKLHFEKREGGIRNQVVGLLPLLFRALAPENRSSTIPAFTRTKIGESLSLLTCLSVRCVLPRQIILRTELQPPSHHRASRSGVLRPATSSLGGSTTTHPPLSPRWHRRHHPVSEIQLANIRQFIHKAASPTPPNLYPTARTSSPSAPPTSDYRLADNNLFLFSHPPASHADKSLSKRHHPQRELSPQPGRHLPPRRRRHLRPGLRHRDETLPAIVAPLSSPTSAASTLGRNHLGAEKGRPQHGKQVPQGPLLRLPLRCPIRSVDDEQLSATAWRPGRGGGEDGQRAEPEVWDRGEGGGRGGGGDTGGEGRTRGWDGGGGSGACFSPDGGVSFDSWIGIGIGIWARDGGEKGSASAAAAAAEEGGSRVASACSVEDEAFVLSRWSGSEEYGCDCSTVSGANHGVAKIDYPQRILIYVGLSGHTWFSTRSAWR